MTFFFFHIREVIREHCIQRAKDDIDDLREKFKKQYPQSKRLCCKLCNITPRPPRVKSPFLRMTQVTLTAPFGRDSCEPLPEELSFIV
jgi:hypothetical protein